MKCNKLIEYRMKCSKCGVTIRFEYNDITFCNEPFNRGGFIKCPWCGERLEIHYCSNLDKFILRNDVEIIEEET